MIHRIVIDMMFPDIDPLNDILEEVKRHEHQAITINPGQLNAEHSSVTVQECLHDDYPSTPCRATYEWTSP